MENCEGDSSCQSACQEKNPCGAQHPKPGNKTASTTATPTTASTTSSTDAVYTGLGEGSAADAQPKSGDAMANVIGRTGCGLSMGISVSVLLIGFGLFV